MSVVTSLTVGAGGDANSSFVLQEAITAYSHEAYTNARKIVGTGIIGDNPNINTDTETYIGQVRWYKPLSPTVNVASLTSATDGTKTSYAQDYLRYIKTVRTHGASKVNMGEVVTREDGLMKIGRDFGETKAQDEHNALMAVLKGVMVTEALYGAGGASGGDGNGGCSWTSDPTDKSYGFYVDLGGSTKLVADASATLQGAARAESFLTAMGMAWRDYEPDYAYLICSPKVLASLRSANLVDQTKVTEGNVKFETIFNGLFRLIKTRATTALTSAELAKINTGSGTDIGGTECSFIVLPGSLAFRQLAVPIPTEIDRDASKYLGGGETEIWYRWGYVIMPAGYDWIGSETAFPSDASYAYAIEDGTPKALSTITDSITGVTGTWNRKTTSALSLGILPVFHV